MLVLYIPSNNFTYGKSLVRYCSFDLDNYSSEEYPSVLKCLIGNWRTNLSLWKNLDKDIWRHRRKESHADLSTFNWPVSKVAPQSLWTQEYSKKLWSMLEELLRAYWHIFPACLSKYVGSVFTWCFWPFCQFLWRFSQQHQVPQQNCKLAEWCSVEEVREQTNWWAGSSQSADQWGGGGKIAL